MATNGLKHLPKLETANDASFEFSMVRRRSLEEVRWHVHECVVVPLFVSIKLSNFHYL